MYVTRIADNGPFRQASHWVCLASAAEESGSAASSVKSHGSKAARQQGREVLEGEGERQAAGEMHVTFKSCESWSKPLGWLPLCLQRNSLELLLSKDGARQQRSAVCYAR